MARDKKALDGGLTFVLDGPDGVEVVAGVPVDAAREALDRHEATVTTPRLSTERLLMREWRDDDRDPYAVLNADPEVMRHFPSMLTPQQSAEMIDRMAAAWRDRGFGLWAVERLDTSEFIGFVGLSVPAWQASFTPCVEVGWRLGRQHWGQRVCARGGDRRAGMGLRQRRSSGRRDRQLHDGGQPELSTGDGEDRHDPRSRRRLRSPVAP